MALSAEQKEVVLKLTAEGFSARQIAGQIGGGCTRNVIIGIWHRGKIAVPKKQAEKKVVTRPKPKARPTFLRYSNMQAVRMPEIKSQPVVEPEPPLSPNFDPSEPLAASRPVLLENRKIDQCCFPLAKVADRPPYLFCGAIKETEASPYCNEHRRRMRRRDGAEA